MIETTGEVRRFRNLKRSACLLVLIVTSCAGTSQPHCTTPCALLNESTSQLYGLRVTVGVVDHKDGHVTIPYTLEFVDQHVRWSLREHEAFAVFFFDADGQELEPEIARIRLPKQFLDRTCLCTEGTFKVSLPKGARYFLIELGHSGLRTNKRKV
jgi:hypothetical protein